MARQLRGPDAHSSTFKLNFPTAEEQRNQSHQEETGTTQRSKFTGVHWDKRDRTWVVKISHEGQNQHVGCFAAKHEEAAARAYDAAARRLRGPDAHSSKSKLNFPTAEDERRKRNRPAVSNTPKLAQSPPRCSEFVGVAWNKNGCKWQVQIHHEGQNNHIGYFAPEQEAAAARAYDAAARQLRGPYAHSSKSKLNFPTPEEVRNRLHPQPAPAVKVPALLNSETMQSRFIGVSWRTKSGRYANIKGQQGNRFLGGFAHEEEETAARAYDAAARQLRGPEAHGSQFQLNFPTADERMNCIAAGSSKSHTLASRFIGVHKKNGKLVVKISNEGQNMNVGYFAAEQEEAAARAYDAAARQLRGPEAHSSKFKLNFPTPEEERNRPQLAPAAPQTGTSRAETNQQSPRSQFIGVNRNKRDSRWRVSVWHEGRNQQVGHFALEQEEAAARAYDTAARQLRGHAAHSSKSKLNFPTPEEEMNRLHPQLALAPTQHPLSSSESVTTDDLNTDDEPMQMAAAQTEAQLTCHPLVSSDDILDAVPYDAPARQLPHWRRLNFLTEGEVQRAKDKGMLPTEEGRAVAVRRKKVAAAVSERQGPSEFVGVSWEKKRRKWRLKSTPTGRGSSILAASTTSERRRGSSTRLQGGCEAMTRTADDQEASGCG